MKGYVAKKKPKCQILEMGWVCGRTGGFPRFGEWVGRKERIALLWVKERRNETMEGREWKGMRWSGMECWGWNWHGYGRVNRVAGENSIVGWIEVMEQLVHIFTSSFSFISSWLVNPVFSDSTARWGHNASFSLPNKWAYHFISNELKKSNSHLNPLLEPEFLFVYGSAWQRE